MHANLLGAHASGNQDKAGSFLPRVVARAGGVHVPLDVSVARRWKRLRLLCTLLCVQHVYD